MNRQRLARGEGFRNWKELTDAAKRGAGYRDELRRERAGHAGLVQAAEDARTEREAQAEARNELGLGFARLALAYETRASELDVYAANFRVAACRFAARARELGVDPSALELAGQSRASMKFGGVHGKKDEG